MYCAATAVAAISGWTRDQVWMHIRAVREHGGFRVPTHPRGGIFDYEWLHALICAGYSAASPWPRLPRRFTLAEFTKGRSGTWIVRQSGHVFAWRRSGFPRHQYCPTAICIGAVRVERLR